MGIGFLILVGFISYACFRLSQTLQSVNSLVQDAKSITHDVKSLKDQIELGLAKLLTTILNAGTMLLNKKGGKKYGK